jgi:hypothetical protein
MRLDLGALCFHCAATYLVDLLSTLGIYPLVAPHIGRSMYGNGRLGRNSYVLTLTTYADYIPEAEVENPLPEPVAAVPNTNVVSMFKQSG